MAASATISKSPTVIEKKGVPPLHVLMHGLQGSKELFTGFFEETFFSDRAFIASDFPGFGDASAVATSPRTVSAYAAFIEELANPGGQRDVVLIGHSLGGMVATKLLSSKLL